MCLYIQGTVSAADWIHVLLLVIASHVINVTLVITSEECTGGEYNQLWEKLNKTVTDLFM